MTCGIVMHVLLLGLVVLSGSVCIFDMHDLIWVYCSHLYGYAW